MIVGKMHDKIVEIVRVTDRVGFSEERGWICVVGDFNKRVDWQQDIKWVRDTTMFEWVREFNFA